tara:strand:- start:3634 stop:4146 length:513 start_codon:yes stop_codon:yes gene_type:complete
MNNVFNELEYLSNPYLYEKYINQKKTQNEEEFKKNKRFYKKRIIQLTKDLYNNELDHYKIPLTEIKKIFNRYIKEGIDLLKMIDRNDILQDEYKDIKFDKKIPENEIDCSFNQIDNDTEIFKKPQTNKIEDCMPLIKKKIKKEKDIKPPLKKKVNLKDPELKIKGLKIKE